MIVQMVGVEKSYGTTKAAAGINLTVPQGSVMGLIGPNGAGKTTSMQIMASLLQRDAGEVSVAGYDPGVNGSQVRRTLGYMPDFFGVYEGLTAAEYLEFFATVHGVRPHAVATVVASLLELVGLSSKAATDVNGLSRGMKQRLSLARALVHDPDLLVLDEPASGLDPRARFDLRTLIAELSRMGKTVVISSHILSELEGISTHLAVIDHGRVLAQGSIDEIRNALTGQVAVRVRVPDDRIDDALQLLRSFPHATDFATERGLIRFALGGTEDDASDMLSALVQAPIPVYEWRTEAAGLEELFLKITDGGDV